MRIAVASGKGGAGKTTVTASLARVWGDALVAVDADVEAPNLHLFLPPVLRATESVSLEVPVLDKERCTLCGACRDICRYKAIARFAKALQLFPDMCHGCGGCLAVCPQGALSAGARELGVLEEGMLADGATRYLGGRTRIGEAMTPPLLRAQQKYLERMLEEAPADVLLDSPPGVSCPAMTVARAADAVLLVADPTPFGFHDFRLAHEAVRPLGLPTAVAVNRAGQPGNAEGDEAVRAYCREQDLPLLAELPFEREAAGQYAAGRLIADISPAWRRRFEDLRDGLRTFARNAGQGGASCAK